MRSRCKGGAVRMCLSGVFVLFFVCPISGVYAADLLRTQKVVAGKKRPAAKITTLPVNVAFSAVPGEWHAWSDSKSVAIKGKGTPSATSGVYSWSYVDGEPMMHWPKFTPTDQFATTATMPKGPGEFKAKVTYAYGGKTATATTPHTIKFVGARFVRDAAQKYGFDHIANPPWVSVKASDDTTVKLEIYPKSAAAKVHITGTVKAVTPAVVAASPQVVKIKVVATANADPGKIVTARLGSATGPIAKWKEGASSGEAKVRVASFDLVSLPVVIHKTFQSATCSGTIIADANKILKQAVMQATGTGAHVCPATPAYSYPAGPTVHVDNGTEQRNFYDTCHTAAQGIYILKDGSKPDAANLTKEGVHLSWPGGTPPPYILLVKNPSADTLAHELFHNYQANHDTTSGNLMEAVYTGIHLQYYQWKLAHP